MTRVGKMGASAVFVAFGIILPIMFHFVGAIGSIFLPMHIPVLMAGLFLGPVSGFTVGVMAPMLSSLLTGMPPLMPVLPLMTLELAVYGALSGYLYREHRLPLIVALITALIAGRVAALAGVWGLANLLQVKLTLLVYAAGFAKGLPGIVVQLIVIPFLVKRLESSFSKNNLIQESRS
ncbi:ECF transporter S component [Anaerospora hongkongensis]|uniref:ECF transporter S component n=1 Tax=Anaerospora hongkongensis TaxID=244830 RepID=UPI002897B7E5|nr:ECF transporter S component [Anaerospora hongkongensis]